MLSPTEVALHSNKPVNLICSKCGHRWSMSINNRTGVNNEGCSACAGKTISNRELSESEELADYNF